jgi:hypothetical protein
MFCFNMSPYNHGVITYIDTLYSITASSCQCRTASNIAASANAALQCTSELYIGRVNEYSKRKPMLIIYSTAVTSTTTDASILLEYISH